MEPVPDLKPLAPPTTERPAKQRPSSTTTPHSVFEGMLYCKICHLYKNYDEYNTVRVFLCLFLLKYWKHARQSVENERISASNNWSSLSLEFLFLWRFMLAFES